MSGFDDRKKAYENKFANELELDFKVRAKRNKLLGLWAAEKMGIEDLEAEDYARSVVDAAVEGVANETVVNKILTDFNEKDVNISEDELKLQMQQLLEVAKNHFK